MDVRSRLPALLAGLTLALGPIAGLAMAAQPPNAVNDTYETAEDTQEVVDAPGVLGNDTPGPADGNEYCVAVVDDSNLHGTVDWTRDGGFTYDPDPNYNGSGSANSFDYTMYEVTKGAECSGSQPSTATVEITVNPINDPPTARADSFQALKNTTLNIGAPGVLSNDSDVDGDSLTAAKAINPLHGVVVVAPDGSFSYTPATGFTGDDTFYYTASDGVVTSPQRAVTIKVSSIPPIVTPSPIPTPSPAPTLGPTLTPILTPPPEVTLEPGSSPTPFVPPTPQVSGASSPAASGAPSLAPGETPQPNDTSGGAFGSPLTILLGVVLLALIAGVAAAMYGPRWLEARRRRDG